MNTDELRRLLLQRFPFLGELPPNRLDRIVASATVRTAKARALLFDANQPCGGFPLVLEGAIRVAKTAPNGREIASRLLRSFEVRGWVKLDRERVTVLDPKALAELARN